MVQLNVFLSLLHMVIFLRDHSSGIFTELAPLLWGINTPFNSISKFYHVFGALTIGQSYRFLGCYSSMYVKRVCRG